MRIITLAIWLLFLSSLTGCAGENTRDRSLDNVLRSYEHTIRWGKMENVNNYLKEPIEFSKDTFEKMKHIQVTSYRVLSKTINQNELRQLVEIRYYNDEFAVERSITDPQKWEYNEESETWNLISTVPVFK